MVGQAQSSPRYSQALGDSMNPFLLLFVLAICFTLCNTKRETFCTLFALLFLFAVWAFYALVIGAVGIWAFRMWAS